MLQHDEIELSTKFDYASLSLRDLLAARDQYHFHLMNKKHVIGTAVGRYLIRNTDPWPTGKKKGPSDGDGKPKEPRTFENSSVRDYSWPCVIVLVDDWVKEFGTQQGVLHPEEMVPRTLYMADGRMVPVCVVAAEPAAQSAPVPPWAWPSTKLAPGYPIVIEHQEVERFASVGCLVTDGHTTYALTNRHVCGSPGEVVFAMQRGRPVRVGQSSTKQATRVKFDEIYPDYPGRRTYLNLDIGLVELDDLNAWSSNVMELGETSELIDLYEANLGLSIIEGPVRAFGAASGLLEGRIKALFYRYKAVGGYDYVADFLIAPSGNRSTQRGDSGTVWHLHHLGDGLLPLAVEWGAQAFSAESAGQQYNFALATSLSNVCKYLDVELVNDHDLGPEPTWGQTGHYNIAGAAIDAVDPGSNLATLMSDNRTNITFGSADLEAQAIKGALAQAKQDDLIIPLADVPDLVWKQLPSKMTGGRDHPAGKGRSTGPEHPTHFADVDQPHPNGKTLLELCLPNGKPNRDFVNVDQWRKFWDDTGHKTQADRGLLPFRVWQFFDLMVESLKKQDIDHFVCAAGCVAHYIGDACQPLHGSIYADGYKDQPTTVTHKKQADGSTYTTPSNVGAGVHSCYETAMIDRFGSELIPQLANARDSVRADIIEIRSGEDAAIAVLQLMAFTAKTLPPRAIVDAFIAAGGKPTVGVQTALWKKFGAHTVKIMQAGADVLALLWEAAWKAGGGDALPAHGACDPQALQAIYTKPDFAPSLDLDTIGQVLV